MEQRQIRRVGAAAIACALVARFFAGGGPAAVANWLTQPNMAAFLIYLETGRDVRFSSSQAVFAPGFVESPPAAARDDGFSPAFSGGDGLPIYDTSSKRPDLEALLAKPLNWELHGEEPTVLILHTHSTESYTKQGEDYRESAAWRTLDENYNMLSIGTTVAEILDANGIPTIQDTSLHDYPSYNGSYTDARKSMKKLLKENPGIRLVLDLHRDASEGANGQMRTEAIVDGQPSAQLMLVMGTYFDAYEENLALALKLHKRLENQSPGIMRPLQLRAARFNQDLSPGALLIEVGAAGNTHPEALRAAQQLALAIVALSRGTM